MCIMSVHTLLKVVGYKLDGGWVGRVSSIQFFLGFLEFFNFAKPLSMLV